MSNFTAPDGTRLACDVEGSGPPLVLVHGTGGAAARWRGVLPVLAEHFTVYALDRRGRGGSGDAPAYAFAREVEDVATVVAGIGGPVDVLGHSFGALCALEAARLAPPRRLILYEPPISQPGQPVMADARASIEQMEALLAAGDRTGALLTFMGQVVGLPADDLALFQASPAFAARVAAAHTLPRELRAQDAYRFDPARFSDFRTPTRLLLGDDSPAFFRAAITLLAASLPGAEVVELPGQRHLAMDTAPTLFLAAVTGFLGRPPAAA